MSVCSFLVHTHALTLISNSTYGADQKHKLLQHLNTIRYIVILNSTIGQGKVTALGHILALVHQPHHDSAPHQSQHAEGHNAANRCSTQSCIPHSSLLFCYGSAKSTGSWSGRHRKAVMPRTAAQLLYSFYLRDLLNNHQGYTGKKERRMKVVRFLTSRQPTKDCTSLQRVKYQQLTFTSGSLSLKMDCGYLSNG